YGNTHEQPNTSDCLNKAHPPLYSSFLPESAEARALRVPEPKVIDTSKLSNQYLKGWVWKKSEPKTSKSKALKHSELTPQGLRL
ncbi:hypothetical protein A2U01_0064982, partial [Trifolium medium]|nr:hypothetical protein [Trifolium medium]